MERLIEWGMVPQAKRSSVTTAETQKVQQKQGGGAAAGDQNSAIISGNLRLQRPMGAQIHRGRAPTPSIISQPLAASSTGRLSAAWHGAGQRS